MHEAAGILGWIEGSALSHAMRGWLWLYPIVEIVHITGFVILVGAVTMFDLRLLGFAGQLPVQALGRHLLRWSAGGLLLVVPAGLMMFATHPQEFAASGVFRLKLALICVAGINAALFHIGVNRSVVNWDSGVAVPAAAKAHAALSIALWLAVISCGRLLAYT
jgi:hypothetical protein